MDLITILLTLFAATIALSNIQSAYRITLISILAILIILYSSGEKYNTNLLLIGISIISIVLLTCVKQKYDADIIHPASL